MADGASDDLFYFNFRDLRIFACGWNIRVSSRQDPVCFFKEYYYAGSFNNVELATFYPIENNPSQPVGGFDGRVDPSKRKGRKLCFRF